MAGSQAYPISNPVAGTARLVSVDILRGIVMVIMALDHTREWFSGVSIVFDPTDLTRTTPLLFFTRWITHFCAPIFVLLAGSGAYLSFARGKNKADLSMFLFSRGLWLVLLEVLVISPLGWSFNFSFEMTRLQVIWIIGISMMLLGCLIRIWNSRMIAAAGLAMICLHDLFDGPHEAWLGRALPIWKLLHQKSLFQPWPYHYVLSLYPLIPWFGVMMAGYGLGEVLVLPAIQRRRALFIIGAITTLSFVGLRAANIYGDPSPWAIQPRAFFTVLSFLKCSKYPPSLLYLLMTLGPAMIALALLDDAKAWLLTRFSLFGRVPLFYYILHLPLLHGAAVLLSLLLYRNTSGVCLDQASLIGASQSRCACGYGLWVVYTVWIGAVLLLYPLCGWFAALKSRRKEVIFSYL